MEKKSTQSWRSLLGAFGLAVLIHALLGILLIRFGQEPIPFSPHPPIRIEWSEKVLPQTPPVLLTPWTEYPQGSKVTTLEKDPKLKPRRHKPPSSHPTRSSGSLLGMRATESLGSSFTSAPTEGTVHDPASTNPGSSAGEGDSKKHYPNLLAAAGAYDGPLGPIGKKDPGAGGTTRRAADGDMPFGWEDPETGSRLAKERINTMVADVSAEHRAKTLFVDPYLQKVERSIASHFAPPVEMLKIRNRFGTLAAQQFERKVARWYDADIEILFSPSGQVISTLVVNSSGNSRLDQLALETVQEAVSKQRLTVKEGTGRVRYRVSAGVSTTPFMESRNADQPPSLLSFSFGGPSHDKPGDSLGTKILNRLDYPMKETVQTKVTLLAVYPRKESESIN